jgi:hypothetical protein
MTKINRRDYLIKMGAAAGAMASLPAVSILGEPENSARVDAANPGPGASPQADLLRWVTTETPPNPDAFVTAIFWGLMGFCYKTPSGSPPVVEVGFHRGGGHHVLKVTVAEISTSGTRLICSDLPSQGSRMTLKVVGQGQPPKVFEKGTFNRQADMGDDLDFRWMPDLDSDEFYSEGYNKNKHFPARLEVSNGVFYTRIKTNSHFKLVKAANHLDVIRPSFGRIAWMMALAINVENNTDHVLFEMNGVPCPLRQTTGVRYQILFKNECTHSPCPGSMTAEHPDETRRNDFHFSRKVLKLPNDRIKYSLKFDHRVGPGAQINFFDPDGQEHFTATDEAPCAGAAFGQANGFPT